MRRRELNPTFFANEDLAECSPQARLLFIGLWCLADREGRLEDRPKRIGVSLFPYEPVDADALITELANARMVTRYEVDGHRLLAIPTFSRHQHPHHREVGSVLPPPPSDARMDPPNTNGTHLGAARDAPRHDPGTAQPPPSRAGPSGPTEKKAELSLVAATATAKTSKAARERTNIELLISIWNLGVEDTPIPKVAKFPTEGTERMRLVRRAISAFPEWAAGEPGQRSDDAVMAAIFAFTADRFNQGENDRGHPFGFDTFCTHVDKWIDKAISVGEP